MSRFWRTGTTSQFYFRLNYNHPKAGRSADTSGVIIRTIIANCFSRIDSRFHWLVECLRTQCNFFSRTWNYFFVQKFFQTWQCPKHYFSNLPWNLQLFVLLSCFLAFECPRRISPRSIRIIENDKVVWKFVVYTVYLMCCYRDDWIWFGELDSRICP